MTYRYIPLTLNEKVIVCMHKTTTVLLLLLAACSCTALPADHICDAENLACVTEPYSGPPVTRCHVEWDPLWCSEHPQVCDFALRHEAAHVQAKADEDAADCYAASTAAPEVTRAAVQHMRERDPARARRMQQCAPR